MNIQRNGSGCTIDGGMISKSICLLTLFSLLLVNCKREESRAIPTREPFPHEVLEELILKEMHKGSTMWVLNAGKAVNYEEEQVIKVYDIELEFYDDEIVSSVLTADSGAVFMSNKDMRALGNVKVVTREDAFLETDELEWSNVKRLISTETEIRITTQESVITGIGFESDPELKHIKVKREFRAHKTKGKGDGSNY